MQGEVVEKGANPSGAAGHVSSGKPLTARLREISCHAGECRDICPGGYHEHCSRWTAAFEDWLRLSPHEKHKDLGCYLELSQTPDLKPICLAYHLLFHPEHRNAGWIRGTCCGLQACGASIESCGRIIGFRPGQVTWFGNELESRSAAAHRGCLKKSAELIASFTSAQAMETVSEYLNRTQQGICRQRLCLPHYMFFPPACAADHDCRLFLCSVRMILGATRVDQPGAREAREHVRGAVQAVAESSGNVQICVKTLSRRLFVSPGRLAADFRKCVGLGFREYLRNVRVVRAAELLATTSAGVGQIGRQLGTRRQVTLCGSSTANWESHLSGFVHLLLGPCDDTAWEFSAIPADSCKPILP